MKKRLRFEAEEVIGLVLTVLATWIWFYKGASVFKKAGFWPAAGWLVLGVFFALFHVCIWLGALSSERRSARLERLLAQGEKIGGWLIALALLGSAAAAYPACGFSATTFFEPLVFGLFIGYGCVATTIRDRKKRRENRVAEDENKLAEPSEEGGCESPVVLDV